MTTSASRAQAATEIPRFVDAHIHLWKLDSGWYPLMEGDSASSPDEYGVGDYSKIQGRDFLLDEYYAHAERFNVTKLVHVTAADPPTMPHETRWLQELSDRSGVPIAIVGKTHLTRPLEEIEKELAEHKKSSNFRGIRNEEGVDYASDHTLRCFEIMQRMDLVYDAVANEETLPIAARAAERLEGLPFVLEHTGWPSGSDEQTFRKWCKGMRAFAKLPNTSCKISGLGMTMHEWTADDLRPWIRTAIETFGADRCMFATNFPVDWLYSSYDTLLEAFYESTSDFSADDQDSLFASNAERIYRF